VKKLKENGVTIVDKTENFEYGKFVHIMDLMEIKLSFGSL
jgi:hypothetical protein